HLQAGQAVAAKGVVDQIATIKIIPHILDAFAAAAMPARYAIERRRWGEAAALSLPQQGTFAWKDFPHAEAALVFARALGAARGGDADAAKKDLDLLQELQANLIKANSEVIWQEYWVSTIENDRQIVSAWIAYKRCACCEPPLITRIPRNGIRLCRGISSPPGRTWEKCCWTRMIRYRRCRRSRLH